MDRLDGVTPCPNCGSRTLYRGQATGSGGGHSPDFLPGLGKFLVSAKFVLVVCRDCGLTRFFVQPEARAKLKDAKKWKAI
jgi:predicted nucleic-acid-binding Zn-ribbon protein